MASDSLYLAFTDTLVRANLDKFHNLHSSGEANDNMLSSSFHNVISYNCKNLRPFEQYLPSAGFQKNTGIHLGLDTCFKKSYRQLHIMMAQS